MVGRATTIRGLASRDQLREYRQLLLDPAFGEARAQEYLDTNPELFAPLELLEFVRHLRFMKRNLKNPSHAASSTAVRVPDFTGVKFFPEAVPVIVELKSPQQSLLDSSTLGLTNEALVCAKQLREAVVHLLRKEGATGLRRKYGWAVDQAIGDDLLEMAAQLDSDPASTSADWIDLMQRAQAAGVALIALIGRVEEFCERPDLLERARTEFETLGCSLLTYDELHMMNEALLDFASRSSSLWEYFVRTRVIHRSDGTMCRFSESKLLSRDKLNELQALIHRSSEVLCVFGLGNPPRPSRVGGRSLMWRASAPFDVTMLWEPPTHLKGSERLLWAGRIENRWFVMKERLTQPFLGEAVWYEFSPPVITKPVFHQN